MIPSLPVPLAPPAPGLAALVWLEATPLPIERLPARDRFYLEGISHPGARHRAATCRHLIADLCRQHGVPYEGVAHDGHGRPYLTNADGHPLEDVRLSLAHAGRGGVAALSYAAPALPLGVDLEAVSQKALWASARFLSDRERQQSPGRQGDSWASSPSRATLAFVLKEAAYKALALRGVSVQSDIALPLPPAEEATGAGFALPALPDLGPLPLQVGIHGQVRAWAWRMGPYWLSWALGG